MSDKAKIKIYDIETWRNYFLVGFKGLDNDEITLYEISELRNDLVKMVTAFDDKSKFFVGYNNEHFDNIVMNALLIEWSWLIKKEWGFITNFLFEVAQTVIDDTVQWKYKQNKYRVQFYQSVDLMQVGSFSMKSLKSVAINLKWPRIQDLPYSPTHLVSVDEIDTIREYNENDVLMTEALFHSLRKDINLRAGVTNLYGVNVMNESDSHMANRLLEHMYSKATGLDVESFKELRTYRSDIIMEDVLLPEVEFKTKKMKQWLKDIRYKLVSEGFSFRVRINKGVYQIGKGGLHSNNPTQIYESTDDTKIIDADVGSYYPTTMVNFKLKPEHLDDKFIDLVEEIVVERLAAKKRGDTVVAGTYKIMTVSFFGKTGNKNHWLYDPFCMYSVTINGQMFLLMLIEDLEEAGIEVVYANTDGITARVKEDQEATYYSICNEWEKLTNYALEYDEFKKAVIRDVNNFIIEKKDGSVKMKGVLDTNRWKTLTKGFDKPIIPLAIRAFFIDGIPPETFIPAHQDTFDFCMAQNSGAKFSIFYDYINMDTRQKVRKKLQKTNRYYVSKGGGALVKSDGTKEISIVAGETVTVFNDVGDDVNPINYRWYIKEANRIIQQFQSKQLELL